MPSITFWNRLEPSLRAPSITEGLAAQIRDPLCLLARQWQLGEFRGEDAASPAFVEATADADPIESWRPVGGQNQPLAPTAPLERIAEAEAFAPDLATRVELGQTLDAILMRANLADVIVVVRGAYPIQRPVNPDPGTALFANVCLGRATDGIIVYQAAKASLPNLPPGITIDSARRPALRSALESFVQWVDAVFGGFGSADPLTWKPERLEYDIEVVATRPDGGSNILAAYPTLDGSFDWYSFNLRSSTAGERRRPRPPIRKSFLPTYVRFRGMPNARWWDFENNVTNFGDVKPDLRDVAKLVVMDFMIVGGNDWFMIPFEQAIGTAVRMRSIVVHDVFGGLTLIQPARSQGTQRWNMFAPEREDASGQLADFFVLPPSVTAVVQAGAPLEDVRFIRDEMANMVWAIEHSTENGIGEPWRGHERAVSRPAPPTSPPSAGGAPPLRYQIQTTVPENWIPFLPVLINASTSEIALERGAMIGEPLQPLGRILNPTGVGGPYRVREEEIARTGLQLSRLVFRSRWIDGATSIWIARVRTSGRGEGSSGLKFDLAMSDG
jgi:hypothetical protein